MQPVTYGRAGEGDLPRLREIFLLCFGREAEAEMEYIFGHCAHALWCARVENTPAALLAALPVMLALPDGEYPARYFYGVATHPDYRRQGLCGGLLAACCDEMEKRGEAAALLRPDSEKNRLFYRKNGFADCSTVKTGAFTAAGGTALPCTRAEPEQYDAVRRKFAPWGLQWGRDGLALQKGWMRLYGGDLWLFGAEESPLGCAAVSCEGEEPLVRELLCAEADAAAALEGLCCLCGAKRLRLALPGPMTFPAEDGETRPMMMLRATGTAELPKAIYTPLAMD